MRMLLPRPLLLVVRSVSVWKPFWRPSKPRNWRGWTLPRFSVVWTPWVDSRYGEWHSHSPAFRGMAKLVNAWDFDSHIPWFESKYPYHWVVSSVGRASDF